MGNATAYTYDLLGRITQETTLQGARSFAYNAAGNLLRKTDRNGRSTAYCYDNLGYRTAENWLSGQNVVNTIGYTYDRLGELLTASESGATDSYSYNSLGQTTSTTQSIAGLTPSVTLTQQYGVLGGRTQLAAAFDGWITDFVNDYSYNSLGQMTSIEQHGVEGGNPLMAKSVQFTYNADGQFSTISRFAALAGAQTVATTFGYDLAGRLTALEHAYGPTTLTGYGWTYDAAGRLTQQTSAWDGAVNYAYDSTGQLTAADYTGVQADESYSYDANGNRTATGYQTGADNQLLSDGVFTYAYDAEGNRTSRTRIASAAADDFTTEYAWDHRNRLAAVTFKDNAGEVTKCVTYSYDAFDRLVGKAVDVGLDGTDRQERYVYDGNQIVLQFEREGDGGLTLADLKHRYLWGPAVDQLLADEQTPPWEGENYRFGLPQPSDLKWPLTDHLGTVRDLAAYDAQTGAATIVNHRVFDAYGNLKSETHPAVDCAFRFTGRLFDADSGLQYNHHRWYDPAVGRWISKDPMGFAAGDANLSRYVGNRPVTRIDPTGLFWGGHSSGGGSTTISSGGTRGSGTLQVDPNSDVPWGQRDDGAMYVGPPGSQLSIPDNSMVFFADDQSTIPGHCPPEDGVRRDLPEGTSCQSDVKDWSDTRPALYDAEDGSLSAVVLAGHGADGGGVHTIDPNSELNYGSLDSETLALLQNKLGDNGVIIILGCSQAQPLTSQELQDLADATGHPVIANTGLVRGTTGEGDWMEFQPGGGGSMYD